MYNHSKIIIVTNLQCHHILDYMWSDRHFRKMSARDVLNLTPTHLHIYAPLMLVPVLHSTNIINTQTYFVSKCTCAIIGGASYESISKMCVSIVSILFISYIRFRPQYIVSHIFYTHKHYNTYLDYFLYYFFWADN